MVSGSDHNGGILHVSTIFDIMKWRVGIESLKHLFTVGTCTIIRSPIPAYCEKVITKHVHNTHLRNSHSEQVWALVYTGTDKKSAVRATHDGTIIRRGIIVVHEILTCRDKVIKHILFLQLSAGDMPFLTIFVATSKVSLCIDSTFFEERKPHS